MKILKHNLKFTQPLKKRTRTNYIILHHYASNKGTVEDVHRWHLARGFSGVGYNFLVYKDGTIIEGRGLEKVGAHCSNYNSVSVGISVEGNYETTAIMPKEQFYAVAWLVNYVKSVYPNAKIVGHGELAPTACPGKYYPLDEMKTQYKHNAEIAEQLEKEGSNGGEIVTRYKKLGDVPESYSQVIKELVDKGIIKGKGNGEIDLSEDMCRCLVFMYRMLKHGK